MEEEAKQKPSSKFKTWIRAVALLVVVVFVPEQAAWAMGYDPSVIWAPRYYLGTGQAGYVANFVAENVRRSLNAIANKPLGRVEVAPNLTVQAQPLEESDALQQISSESSSGWLWPYFNRISFLTLKTIIRTLEFATSFGKSKQEIVATPAAVRGLIEFLKGSLEFTAHLPKGALSTAGNYNADYMYLTSSTIKEIYNWLRDPSAQVDNYCGVYALHSLLKAHKIEISLEELALRVILVDLLAGNIKELKGKLKTSLFALNEVANSFGLKLYPVKIDKGLSPKGTVPEIANLNLNLPFIAHLNSDHFIYITRITEGMVYYPEKDKEEFIPVKLFLNKFSGYLLAEKEITLTGKLTKEEASGILGGYTFRRNAEERQLDLMGSQPAWTGATSYGSGIPIWSRIKWEVDYPRTWRAGTTNYHYTYGDVAKTGLIIGTAFLGSGVLGSGASATGAATSVGSRITSLSRLALLEGATWTGVSVIAQNAGSIATTGKFLPAEANARIALDSMTTGILLGYALGGAGIVAQGIGTPAPLVKLESAISQLAATRPLTYQAIKWAGIGATTNVVRGYMDNQARGIPYTPQQGILDFGTGAALGAIAGPLSSRIPILGPALTGKTSLSKLGASALVGGTISTVGGYVTPVVDAEYIYAKGSNDQLTRIGVDIKGYHWDPFNRPEKYRLGWQAGLFNFGIGAVVGGTLGSMAGPWSKNIQQNLSTYGKTINIGDVTFLAKASLKGAAEFAVIMPAWSAIDTTIVAAGGCALGKEHKFDWWGTAAERQFVSKEEAQNPSLGVLANGLFMHSLSGMQTGLWMGPLISVLAPPHTAYVGEAGFDAQGWLAKRVSAFSTNPTISNLVRSAINPEPVYQKALREAVMRNLGVEVTPSILSKIMAHPDRLGFIIGFLDTVEVGSEVGMNFAFPLPSKTSLVTPKDYEQYKATIQARKELGKNLAFAALLYVPHHTFSPGELEQEQNLIKTLQYYGDSGLKGPRAAEIKSILQKAQEDIQGAAEPARKVDIFIEALNKAGIIKVPSQAPAVTSALVRENLSEPAKKLFDMYIAQGVEPEVAREWALRRVNFPEFGDREVTIHPAVESMAERFAETPEGRKLIEEGKFNIEKMPGANPDTGEAIPLQYYQWKFGNFDYTEAGIPMSIKGMVKRFAETPEGRKLIEKGEPLIIEKMPGVDFDTGEISPSTYSEISPLILGNKGYSFQPYWGDLNLEGKVNPKVVDIVRGAYNYKNGSEKAITESQVEAFRNVERLVYDHIYGDDNPNQLGWVIRMLNADMVTGKDSILPIAYSALLRAAGEDGRLLIIVRAEQRAQITAENIKSLLGKDGEQQVKIISNTKGMEVMQKDIPDSTDALFVIVPKEDLQFLTGLAKEVGRPLLARLADGRRGWDPEFEMSPGLLMSAEFLAGGNAEEAGLVKEAIKLLSTKLGSSTATSSGDMSIEEYRLVDGHKVRLPHFNQELLKSVLEGKSLEEYFSLHKGTDIDKLAALLAVAEVRVEIDGVEYYIEKNGQVRPADPQSGLVHNVRYHDVVTALAHALVGRAKALEAGRGDISEANAEDIETQSNAKKVINEQAVNALFKSGLKSLTLTSGSMTPEAVKREAIVLGAKTIGTIPELRFNSKIQILSAPQSSVIEEVVRLIKGAVGYNRIITLAAKGESLDRIVQAAEQAVKGGKQRLILIDPLYENNYWEIKDGKRIPLSDNKGTPQEKLLCGELLKSSDIIVLVSHAYTKSTSLSGSPGTDIISVADSKSLLDYTLQSSMRLRTASLLCDENGNPILDKNGLPKPDYSKGGEVTRKIILAGEKADIPTLIKNQIESERRENYRTSIDNSLRTPYDAVERLVKLAPEATSAIDEWTSQRIKEDRHYTSTNLRGDVEDAKRSLEETARRSIDDLREACKPGGILEKAINPNNQEARAFLEEISGDSLTRGEVPLGAARTPAELRAALGKFLSDPNALPAHAPKYTEPGMVDAKAPAQIRSELGKEAYEPVTAEDLFRGMENPAEATQWAISNGHADPGTHALYLDSPFLPLYNNLLQLGKLKLSPQQAFDVARQLLQPGFTKPPTQNTQSTLEQFGAKTAGKQTTLPNSIPDLEEVKQPPAPEIPANKAVVIDVKAQEELRKNWRAGYLGWAQKFDNTITAQKAKEMPIQEIYAELLAGYYHSLRDAGSYRPDKLEKEDIVKIASQEKFDEKGNRIVSVEEKNGFYFRFADDSLKEEPYAVSRVSLNVHVHKALIEALDNFFINNKNKKIRGYFKVASKESTSSQINDPLTLYFFQDVTPEMKAAIVSIAGAYVREYESAEEGDVFWGEKLAPGIALVPEMQPGEEEAMLERAKGIDPDLERAVLVLKEAQKGLSAGDWQALRIIIEESERVVRVITAQKGGAASQSQANQPAAPAPGAAASEAKQQPTPAPSIAPEVKQPQPVQQTAEVESEFNKLLERIQIQIDGDISLSGLKLNGFNPKYKIVLNGITYYLSEPYISSENERPYFTAFIYRVNPETGKEEIFARTIYKSNSQNVWRVASHKGPGGWIGKGLGEETTNAPLEIQSLLEKIYLAKGELKVQKGFYEVLIEEGYLAPEDFSQTIVFHGKELNGGISIGNFTDKGNPASFKFLAGYEPDLENGIVETFESKNPIYGTVKLYRILSTNRQIQFIFNVDSEDRVWVGAVQPMGSRLTRFGVRADRVNVDENLLMPANEYYRQIPEQFRGEHKVDSYYDASAFLNQIPAIIEFRANVLESPEPVKLPRPDFNPIEGTKIPTPATTPPPVTTIPAPRVPTPIPIVSHILTFARALGDKAMSIVHIAPPSAYAEGEVSQEGSITPIEQAQKSHPYTGPPVSDSKTNPTNNAGFARVDALANAKGARIASERGQGEPGAKGLPVEKTGNDQGARGVSSVEKSPLGLGGRVRLSVPKFIERLRRFLKQTPSQKPRGTHNARDPPAEKLKGGLFVFLTSKILPKVTSLIHNIREKINNLTQFRARRAPDTSRKNSDPFAALDVMDKTKRTVEAGVLRLSQPTKTKPEIAPDSTLGLADFKGRPAEGQDQARALEEQPTKTKPEIAPDSTLGLADFKGRPAEGQDQARALEEQPTKTKPEIAPDSTPGLADFKGRPAEGQDQARALEEQPTKTKPEIAPDSTPGLADFKGNSIEGTIEEITGAVVDYIIQNGIVILGIGERMHSAFSLGNVMIPYLLPAFRKAGFKDLIVENLFKDISRNEWEIVYKELRKYANAPIDVKFRALKDLVLNNPDKLPKLNLNYEEIVYNKDGLLLLIIEAYRLGVNLYGMIRSEQATKATITEMAISIKEGGEAEAQRLKKTGKVMIYGGDEHVSCLPLRPSPNVPEPDRVTFGSSFYRDTRYPYLNLSIVNGTLEDIERRKNDFGEMGYNFYTSELKTLGLGNVRIRVIRSEYEHRILLIYHSPCGTGTGLDNIRNTNNISNTENKGNRIGSIIRNIFRAQGCAFVVETAENNKESAFIAAGDEATTRGAEGKGSAFPVRLPRLPRIITVTFTSVLDALRLLLSKLNDIYKGLIADSDKKQEEEKSARVKSEEADKLGTPPEQAIGSEDQNKSHAPPLSFLQLVKKVVNLIRERVKKEGKDVKDEFRGVEPRNKKFRGAVRGREPQGKVTRGAPASDRKLVPGTGDELPGRTEPIDTSGKDGEPQGCTGKYTKDEILKLIEKAEAQRLVKSPNLILRFCLWLTDRRVNPLLKVSVKQGRLTGPPAVITGYRIIETEQVTFGAYIVNGILYIESSYLKEHSLKEIILHERIEAVSNHKLAEELTKELLKLLTQPQGLASTVAVMLGRAAILLSRVFLPLTSGDSDPGKALGTKLKEVYLWLKSTMQRLSSSTPSSSATKIRSLLQRMRTVLEECVSSLYSRVTGSTLVMALPQAGSYLQRKIRGISLIPSTAQSLLKKGYLRINSMVRTRRSLARIFPTSPIRLRLSRLGVASLAKAVRKKGDKLTYEDAEKIAAKYNEPIEVVLRLYDRSLSDDDIKTIITTQRILEALNYVYVVISKAGADGKRYIMVTNKKPVDKIKVVGGELEIENTYSTNKLPISILRNEQVRELLLSQIAGEWTSTGKTPNILGLTNDGALRVQIGAGQTREIQIKLNPYKYSSVEIEKSIEEIIKVFKEISQALKAQERILVSCFKIKGKEFYEEFYNADGLDAGQRQSTLRLLQALLGEQERILNLAKGELTRLNSGLNLGKPEGNETPIDFLNRRVKETKADKDLNEAILEFREQLSPVEKIDWTEFNARYPVRENGEYVVAHPLLWQRVRQAYNKEIAEAAGLTATQWHKVVGRISDKKYRLSEVQDNQAKTTRAGQLNELIAALEHYYAKVVRNSAEFSFYQEQVEAILDILANDKHYVWNIAMNKGKTTEIYWLETVLAIKALGLPQRHAVKSTSEVLSQQGKKELTKGLNRLGIKVLFIENQNTLVEQGKLSDYEQQLSNKNVALVASSDVYQSILLHAEKGAGDNGIFRGLFRKIFTNARVTFDELGTLFDVPPYIIGEELMFIDGKRKEYITIADHFMDNVFWPIIQELAQEKGWINPDGTIDTEKLKAYVFAKLEVEVDEATWNALKGASIDTAIAVLSDAINKAKEAKLESISAKNLEKLVEALTRFKKVSGGEQKLPIFINLEQQNKIVLLGRNRELSREFLDKVAGRYNAKDWEDFKSKDKVNLGRLHYVYTVKVETIIQQFQQALYKVYGKDIVEAETLAETLEMYVQGKDVEKSFAQFKKRILDYVGASHIKKLDQLIIVQFADRRQKVYEYSKVAGIVKDYRVEESLGIRYAYEDREDNEENKVKNGISLEAKLKDISALEYYEAVVVSGFVTNPKQRPSNIAEEYLTQWIHKGKFGKEKWNREGVIAHDEASGVIILQLILRAQGLGAQFVLKSGTASTMDKAVGILGYKYLDRGAFDTERFLGAITGKKDFDAVMSDIKEKIKNTDVSECGAYFVLGVEPFYLFDKMEAVRNEVFQNGINVVIYHKEGRFYFARNEGGEISEEAVSEDKIPGRVKECVLRKEKVFILLSPDKVEATNILLVKEVDNEVGKKVGNWYGVTDIVETTFERASQMLARKRWEDIFDGMAPWNNEEGEDCRKWDNVYVLGVEGALTLTPEAFIKAFIYNAKIRQEVYKTEKNLENVQTGLHAFAVRVFDTIKKYAKDAESRERIEEIENDFFFNVKWGANIPSQDMWDSGAERVNEVVRYYRSFLTSKQRELNRYLTPEGVKELNRTIGTKEVNSITFAPQGQQEARGVFDILRPRQVPAFDKFIEALGKIIRKEDMPSIAGYRASFEQNKMATPAKFTAHAKARMGAENANALIPATIGRPLTEAGVIRATLRGNIKGLWKGIKGVYDEAREMSVEKGKGGALTALVATQVIFPVVAGVAAVATFGLSIPVAILATLASGTFIYGLNNFLHDNHNRKLLIAGIFGITGLSLTSLIPGVGLTFASALLAPLAVLGAFIAGSWIYGKLAQSELTASKRGPWAKPFEK